MISCRSTLLIALAASTALNAATAQTAPKKLPTAPTHRTAATTARPATPAANSKDNPPNVPKIEGTPKPLYSLRFVDTVIGTGPIAEPRQYYTVHYTGWLPDGTKFDSSVDRGTPITFPYGAHQVIPGWDTGFQDMHVGGKRRLYIPYQLAYGEAGRPPVIPAKSDLIFDVELIGQSDTPPAPPAPAQPATDPAKPANPAKPGDTTTPPGSETTPKTTSNP